MNYGKFFRLNKNLSRIEDGFAVYDYIDLPAYFTPSTNNLMSPKYPVSMMILGDSVAFKLHYSAYKIETALKFQTIEKPNHKVPEYPQYIYDIKSKHKVNVRDTTKIVHMEEIILDLPFTDTVGRSLSDTIRDIYQTPFPLIQKEGGVLKSSGGRFLESLIRRRYLEENVFEDKDLDNHFYEPLRKISDGTTSYSTLWLMELVKKENNNIRYRRTDNEGKIIDFLRKLLLDFMFDLKHSDVFQNSSQFQKVYSGLMSNFYFSALMHKCEYYYYRDLTKAAIEKSEGNLTANAIENIKVLYASELFKAEELWIQDIMNPLAEKYFTHQLVDSEPKEEGFLKKLKNIGVKCGLIESDVFRNWPSWFAEPEEEMRRVFFCMKEDNQGKGINCGKENDTTNNISNSITAHLCNSDILTQHLKIDQNDPMALQSSVNREIVSAWFLRRYDFNDVAHLHLFRYANLLLFICLIPLLFVLYFVPFNLQLKQLEPIIGITAIDCICAYMPCAIMIVVVILLYFLFKFYYYKEKQKLNVEKGSLLETYFELSKKRVNMFFGTLILLIFAASNFYIFLVLVLLAMVYATQSGSAWFEFYFKKLTAYLHLLFPRLVASITTAWLTMSMGFDLYNTFFDKEVSWPTAFMIALIVLVFILYGINKITPYSHSLKKLLRSFELLIISYCISLIVGFIVVDFVGNPFLERGGFIDDFHKEYVYDQDSISKLSYVDNQAMDSVTKHNKVMQLTENQSMVATFKLGNHDIFYMHNFLFMFSFVAMFIGIFLQMVLFEEKQMTEL